jgi:hypothetical protein
MTAGQDYYITADGLLVFTAAYLAKRGSCCGNGCLNCPYNYINVPQPRRQKLLEQRKINEQSQKR